MTEARVGIFGGAFDPVHNGHIALAKAMLERLGLTQLLILPTPVSPHKKTSQTSFEHRFEMCKLAFSFDKRITVSDLETKLPAPNYTFNTLRELKKQYPKKTKFFLIIGADMLYSFESWYRFEAIMKESQVIAAARNDGEYPDMLEFANTLPGVRVLNLPVYVASSTDVRKRLKMGEKPDTVPDAVYEYIREHELYQ